MRRIFNSHPEFVCPPETFYLRHYAALLRDPQVHAGYKSFGYNYEMMRAHLAKQGSQLHEALRRANGKNRWADKTPQYVAILPELKELYPDAQFVMIYRNPLDVAYSVSQRGWTLAETPVDDLFASNLQMMRHLYRLQIEFEKGNCESCVRVYYEDLVANPEQELKHLMSALGESFHEVLLRHHEQSHNFGTEDPIARGTKGFVASHGNWRRWRSSEIEQATSILGEVAAELKYSLDRSVAPAGGRIR